MLTRLFENNVHQGFKIPSAVISIIRTALAVQQHSFILNPVSGMTMTFSSTATC